MVKIRLRRMGARNRPYYRIVVSDSRRTARSEVLEELGSYDPVVNPPTVSVRPREGARVDRQGSPRLADDPVAARPEGAGRGSGFLSAA